MTEDCRCSPSDSFKGSKQPISVYTMHIISKCISKNWNDFVQTQPARFEQNQAVRRHGTAWVETLRYRKAEFEAMGGLRRITLNENILIGDKGVTSLAQELIEDLWVKG